MKKKYFTLQLKSVFKVYPMILLITLITILAIIMACFFVTGQKNEKEEKQEISIGVVGDLEDTYLKIGLYALQNFDSSRFYINFTNYTEEEAVKALKDRNISGYVFIPKNYINSILYGRNKQAKYVTLNAPEGFGTIVSTEVAETVSHIVTESQKGMYCMQDLAQDYNNTETDKNIDKLMMSYMNMILGRNEMYEIKTLGIKDS
ncbi:MAG: ABC transporter permease, partial [Clostridia bacterium]|nr:ABC transporter permease [Clostridia bacterium]